MMNDAQVEDFKKALLRIATMGGQANNATEARCFTREARDVARSVLIQHGMFKEEDKYKEVRLKEYYE